MKPKIDAFKDWLTSCSKSTADAYKRYFTLFEEFMGKSGEAMLKEARSLAADPETLDYYPKKVFEFYKYLEAGNVKVWERSSSRAARTAKVKPLSQNTCRTAITSIQSFFAFNNLPINLKKFKAKAPKLQRPQPEKRKRLLLSNEIQLLFRLANAREKAILAIGCMGQDASTTVSLQIEQCTDKLQGAQLEFIDMLRPKANERILLLLTCEVQRILSDYVRTLKRSTGPLFEGYQSEALKPDQTNDIFKLLCAKASIKENGKRVSFHCLRMWFSTQLRNKVSDDLIDLMTGHQPRFGGAYIADDESKLRELLKSANVEDLLKLSEAPPMTPEIAEMKKTISELQQQVKQKDDYFDQIVRKLQTNIDTLGGELAKTMPKEEIVDLIRKRQAESKAEKS